MVRRGVIALAMVWTGYFYSDRLAIAAAHAGTLAIPLVAELRLRIAQSDPEAEWEETQLKAQAMLRAFELS